MNNPYGLVIACRCSLLLLVPLCVIAAFALMPQSLFAEMAASGVIGFVLLLLTQLAFPWHRKADLMPLVLGGMIVMTVSRAAVLGSPWLIIDCIALAAGMAVANLAFGVERMRTKARRYGNTSFSIIRIEEERRNRRKTIRRAGGNLAGAWVGRRSRIRPGSAQAKSA